MGDYWEENGIKKPQQIVVCAACKIADGTIFCGPRHCDATMRLQAVAAGYIDKFPPNEDGFIDQFGDFLTRKEAYSIVRRNGQSFDEERNGSRIDLYSEGLY